MLISSHLDHRGRHRVAITGLGVMSPAGNDLATFWSRLNSGESCAKRIERFDPSELTVQIGCEVPDFDVSAYVTPKEARRLDRVSILGFAAAADALADANAHGTPIEADPSRCGIIAGVGIGGLITLEEQIGVMIEKGPNRVSPFLVPMMMTNATPALVSLQFGWTGPNIAVATACAAGTNAIGDAANLIRYGESDVAIGMGAESCMTPVAISAFGRMTALSGRTDDPSRASRPFDEGRDGFVMGEGAGALILERWDLAVARGARIYGEIVGYGRNSDSHHITAPSPGGAGAAACIELALQDAAIAANAIGHVNAHGTSTPLNDAAEAEAVTKVFGPRAVPVTSTKGITGHLIGAAGAVEAVAAVLSMAKQQVPPTANLDQVDPAFELDVVAGATRAIPSACALSNSFGFGGHNASLIVSPAQ